MKRVEAFFREVDEHWPGARTDEVRLQIIGASALLLQTDYDRGTKDGDVLETDALDADTATRLLGIAGRGTHLHKRHGMYVEIVDRGIPFLPEEPKWNRLSTLNRALINLEIEVLDVVDVVVSKLKRFWPNDVADIEAMIERDLVPHDLLITRFESMVETLRYDARAEELPACVKNLQRIERDTYGVTETYIELPSWVEED